MIAWRALQFFLDFFAFHYFLFEFCFLGYKFLIGLQYLVVHIPARFSGFGCGDFEGQGGLAGKGVVGRALQFFLDFCCFSLLLFCVLLSGVGV